MVLVLLLLLVGAPTGCVAFAVLWARWLRRRNGTPRSALWAAYLLVFAAGVKAASTLLGLLISAVCVAYGPASTPAERQRALAKGFADASYDGALSVLVAFVGLLWLGFCTWKWGGATRLDEP